MAPNPQPFIYAPPPRYSTNDPYQGFDPKPVTRASLLPPAPPRPRPQHHGPLLEFNKHPDTYLKIPYGQTDAKPMPDSTSKCIKLARGFQLSLRLLQMLAALGMLVCVICIQKTQDTESYIIRVPPAVDILTTGYAIYHLCRAAKSRTPASSASYHLFALVIDIGLIPFYVFVALLAKAQSAKPPHDAMRWKSLFTLPGTNKVLLSTWLDSVVLGSLHLVACAISLYLIIIFRKISQLPPDLNPLEDNLTSRRKSKHKYKNSELSTSDIGAPMSNNAVSLSKSGSSALVKESAKVEVRPLSFLHTRAHSNFNYSPHNPTTANLSRSHAAIPSVPSVYSQPRSELLSRIDMSRGQVSGDSDAGHDNDADHTDIRTRTMQSERSTMTGSSVYSGDLQTRPTAPAAIPPLPRKSSKRNSLLSDNWFIHKSGDTNISDEENENVSPAISIVDEEDEEEDIIIHRGNRPDATFNFGSLTRQERSYQPVRQHSSYDGSSTALDRQAPLPPPKDDGFVLEPLGMNPPTPPPGQYLHPGQSRPSPKPLHTTTGNSPHPSCGNNTPSKTKYYGDLGSAVSGIRNSPRSSPRSNLGGHNGPYRQNVYRLGMPTGPSDAAISSMDQFYGSSDGIGRRDFAADGPETRMLDSQGRVISRSGADFVDDSLHPEDESQFSVKAGAGNLRGTIRGRNVSGKIAEEGRGGGWKWG